MKDTEINKVNINLIINSLVKFLKFEVINECLMCEIMDEYVLKMK